MELYYFATAKLWHLINYSSIPDITVAGIAAAVSNNWVSIKEASQESDKLIEKFKKNTGVEGRWQASPYQTASDFCFAAAERLIAEKRINREEIGVLVFVSQCTDYDEAPVTACVLQHRLGLPRECAAFDVNLGCSGFVYGVTITGSLLSCANAQYGLLLAGDTPAREKSQLEKLRLSHSSSMLFGDGGSATLLKKLPGGV